MNGIRQNVMIDTQVVQAIQKFLSNIPLAGDLSVSRHILVDGLQNVLAGHPTGEITPPSGGQTQGDDNGGSTIGAETESGSSATAH